MSCTCTDAGPMPQCPEHGYEAVIARLRDENDHLAAEAAQWHGSFTGLAAREKELVDEIDRLRTIARKNLPMVKAHIDKHPDVAKNMIDEILPWLTLERESKPTDVCSQCGVVRERCLPGGQWYEICPFDSTGSDHKWVPA